MPYILTTLRTSHLEFLEKLSAQLENRPPALFSQPGSSSSPIAISVLIVTLAFLSRILLPDLIRASTLLAIVGCLAIVAWKATQPQDPYGLFHLSLNKLPGENSDSDPKSEWLNMGYWKVSSV
jgi:hypothetical protein